MLRDFFNVQKNAINNLFKNIVYLPILWMTLLAGNIGLGIFKSLFYSLNSLNTWSFSLLYSLVEGIVILIIIAAALMMTQLAVFGSGVRRLEIDSFPIMIGKILEIGLIYYIFIGILSFFGNFFYLNTLILILFFFLPIIEGISIGKKRGFQAIKDSFSFMKENFLNFGVISLISILVEYFLIPNYSGENYLSQVFILGILSFFMIYRAHLYEILRDSSRRRREFMRKF